MTALHLSTTRKRNRSSQMRFPGFDFNRPRVRRPKANKKKKAIESEQPLGGHGQGLLIPAELLYDMFKDIVRWNDSKRHAAPPTEADVEAGLAVKERVLCEPKFRTGDHHLIYDSFLTVALRDAEVTVVINGTKVIKVIRAWGSDDYHKTEMNYKPTVARADHDNHRKAAERAFGDAIWDLRVRQAQENGELEMKAEKEILRDAPSEEKEEAALKAPAHYDWEGPLSDSELATALAQWDGLMKTFVYQFANEYDEDLHSALRIRLAHTIQKKGNNNHNLFREVLKNACIRWLDKRKALKRRPTGGLTSIDVDGEDGFSLAECISDRDGRDDVSMVAEDMDRDIERQQGITGFHTYSNRWGMPEGLRATLDEVLTPIVKTFDSAYRRR